MGLAAIEGAALNVRVNVANLDDDTLAALPPARGIR